jgi:iron complex outermembrane receptor protein
MSDLNVSGDQLAGTYDQPKWRGIFSTEWKKGNWSSAVFIDYTGRFDRFAASGKAPTGSIASQTIVNPQVSYAGLFNTKITIGARNVFDRDPPFDNHTSTGWNSDIHNPEKAFVYVRLEKTF